MRQIQYLIRVCSVIPSAQGARSGIFHIFVKELIRVNSIMINCKIHSVLDSYVAPSRACYDFEPQHKIFFGNYKNMVLK